MSLVYNQLARKDASPEEQPAEIRPRAEVQLELALPDLAPAAPPADPRARRARPSSLSPAPAGGFGQCELQTKLSGARSALALNKEIIGSLRRDLAAANAARQAAQEKLAALQGDLQALQEENAALAAKREPNLKTVENPVQDTEALADFRVREEAWAAQRQEMEGKILQAEAAAQKTRQALAEEQRLRQEERRQAIAREQELKAQLLAARRAEEQVITNLSGRSRQMRIGAVAAAVLLVVGLGLALFMPGCPRQETAGTAGPAAEVVPAKLSRPASEPEPVSGPVGALPAVALQGLSVQPAGNGIRIVFDNGLFARRATMTAEAQALLKELAGQLLPAMQACRLEITGHADPEPASDAEAPDNNTLGLQRARAVAEYLAGECGLPAGAITVVSAGDVNTPYPNTTPELRRKNRTVTLLLVPR